MSTSGADTVQYNQSLQGPVTPDFTYRNRRFLEIRDQQGGEYSAGQVFFDLTSLVSNNLYVDWSETVLQIPINVLFSITANATGTNSAQFNTMVMSMGYSWSLKNTVYQLINGFTLNVGNQTVVPLQTWSFIPIVHEILTSWNANDVAVLGDTIMFGKDDTESIAWLEPDGDSAYFEDNSFLGRSTANYLNIATPGNTLNANQQLDMFYTLPFMTGNAGRWKRARLNLVPGNVVSANNALNAIQGSNFGFFGSSGFTTNSRAGTSGLGTVTFTPDNQDLTTSSLALMSTAVTYALTLKIPMRFMHDIFAKTPLIRGALWQLYVHLTIPCTALFKVGAMTTHSHNYIPYETEPQCTTAVAGYCPFIVSPVSNAGATERGFATPFFPTAFSTGLCLNSTGEPAAGAVQFTVTMQVPQKSGACVLQVCMADLDLPQNEKYMANPVKQVVYRDWIRVQNSSMMNKTMQDNPLRSTITSGMGNLRQLLVFPYLPKSMVNGVSSAGGTALPYFYATQLQVYISGRPLFDKPIDYTFDQFWREIKGCGAPDGAANDGFRVGMIGERDYVTGYGALVINLERHAADSDSVPVSVDIEFNANWGTNNANSAASPAYSLVAYLKFDRTFKINCLTGQLM